MSGSEIQQDERRAIPEFVNKSELSFEGGRSEDEGTRTWLWVLKKEVKDGRSSGADM